MQRVKPRLSRVQAYALLIAILILLGLGIWGVTRLFGPKDEAGVSASLLPCPYSEEIKPFGKNVLYYDGMSLHCMSDTGTVRWSFQLGNNAGYHCTDDMITAWVGSTVYILDANGRSTYNDNLGEEIQFARIGNQYIAAVIGSTTSPRLLVKDHTGAYMDEESDAYNNLILLDVGFYGKSGEYMWTLSLDVLGTAANTILNTFEVGRMNTGETSLGEPITYAMIYENGSLRAINTRKMLLFNERGSQDASADVLVYGWHYLAHEVPERGSSYLLFAPTSQTESIYDIRELRLINGSEDKRYSLPDSCVGAVIHNRTIYAVSGTTLYRAGLNDRRFTTFELPVDGEVTRVIGLLSSGRIIVSVGDEIYTLSLPQQGG